MDDFSNYYEQQPVTIKHSGLGIASFIISISVFLLYAGCMILSVVMTRDMMGTPEVINPQNIDMSRYGGLMIVGFAYIGGIIANLAGIVLGIIGIAQKNRKKIFSILGLIFNALLFLGMVGIFAIGIFAMMKGLS